MARDFDRKIDELLGMWARTRRFSLADASHMKDDIIESTAPARMAAVPMARETVAKDAWKSVLPSVVQTMNLAWGTAGSSPDGGSAPDTADPLMLSPLWWRDVAQTIAARTMPDAAPADMPPRTRAATTT